MNRIGAFVIGLLATLASGDFGGRVPLKIRVLYEGTRNPAPNVLITLREAGGAKAVIYEPVSRPDGTEEYQVIPGRYLLSARGGSDQMPIDVQPGGTTITMLVSESGVATGLVSPPAAIRSPISPPATTRSAALLWIGLAFTAALVVFLMITFFVALRAAVPAAAYNNLHFLTALCGGFAGGFVMGDALLRWEQQLADGTKVFISGTAGFALFFLVWLTYPKRTTPSTMPLVAEHAGPAHSQNDSQDKDAANRPPPSSVRQMAIIPPVTTAPPDIYERRERAYESYIRFLYVLAENYQLDIQAINTFGRDMQKARHLFGEEIYSYLDTIYSNALSHRAVRQRMATGTNFSDDELARLVAKDNSLTAWFTSQQAEMPRRFDPFLNLGEKRI